MRFHFFQTQVQASADSERSGKDRKSTRLNSSHTVIYTLSLHDALPILKRVVGVSGIGHFIPHAFPLLSDSGAGVGGFGKKWKRSEEHTSELQSHSDLHSFPTRRSSDLKARRGRQRHRSFHTSCVSTSFRLRCRRRRIRKEVE